MKDKTRKNWEFHKYAKVGTILHQQLLPGDSIFLVLRGPGALCAYLGLPSDHPLAGKDYEEVDDKLDVHGGLTFSGEASKIINDPSFWQYYLFGWDYAHAGDYSFYYDE